MLLIYLTSILNIACILKISVCFHNSTTLTDDDFINGYVMDEYNNVNGRWFIKFYAPWCGHCKHLAPVWEELADLAHTNKADFKIGSVDCTQNRLACDRVEVSGYPSLYVLEEQSAYQFKNRREMESLAAFISMDAYKQYGEKKPIISYEDMPKSSLGKAYNEITKSLGTMFDALSLGFLPPIIQLLIAVGIG